MLFQNPDNQLVGATVEEDLAFGLENVALPSAEIARRVDEVLVQFDLEGLRSREPHLLSGGQRQRTALAGVLAIPRRVLVLDEPTAMLDPAGRDEVLAAVRREAGRGLTVVLVTQEMDEVLLADRVVALAAGRAVFAGRPADLFAEHDLLRELSLGLPPAAEVGLALVERGALASSRSHSTSSWRRSGQARREPPPAGRRHTEGRPSPGCIVAKASRLPTTRARPRSRRCAASI